MSDENTKPNVALVFGASGEQGRAVIEGLHDDGSFELIFAFTDENSNSNSNKQHHYNNNNNNTYLSDGLDATVIVGDISNPEDVRDAFLKTKASAIFLVTTTDLPSELGCTTGFAEAADREFQTIILFFQILKECYEHDRISRHVVFSIRCNVEEYTRKLLDSTGDLWIDPLEDGSIVPHYSAKGRGGAYAMEYLKDIPELKLTLITIPFLYSNFFGFFVPLPNERRSQWMLTACFGDGRNEIDMMSASDLSYIVPNIFANPDKYDGKNLNLASERVSMETIAAEFADLFGKDVIYNPLSVEEVSSLPFPAAAAMAQMCQFIGDPRTLRHDIETTVEVCRPKKPAVFQDWLLSHSNATAFQQVGLDYDAPEIIKVTVFGATSPEGRSVVQGLLADKRKEYSIRATATNIESEKAKAVQNLDPKRVELWLANIDDLLSCQKAVEGADGVFLVTDFYGEAGRDMETEEQHAKNVIDACEAAASVRHLVFSTKESADEMNRVMNLGLAKVQDSSGNEGTVLQFDAKARAAAYARTKKLSVTYVIMPCYSEIFFDMIRCQPQQDGRPGKLVLTLPLKNDQKIMCMSLDDLGPAVANIFDSYQVYAGHEVGLVTDFVTVSEVQEMIEEVISQRQESTESDAFNNSAQAVKPVQQYEQYQLEERETYMKDLGQMFAYLSHIDAVTKRHSVAKTLKLVPSATPLRHWIEQNIDKVAYREKLGLR